MTTGRKPRISTRKQPKQARSRQLVEDILAAAGRILEREGHLRFTAARVAEEAAVSVGSLYQYFPNKEAILFRLQADEWLHTSSVLTAILRDAALPPLERLRAMVTAFFHSECAEARMRGALSEAAPFYGDAPQARELEREWKRLARSFMREALPCLAEARRAMAADTIMLSLAAVGKKVSEMGCSTAEVTAHAQAMGDMFCAYLERLSAG
jgi:AcrR family transcriptional regulator